VFFQFFPRFSQTGGGYPGKRFSPRVRKLLHISRSLRVTCRRRPRCTILPWPLTLGRANRVCLKEACSSWADDLIYLRV